jgi:hypothetical protein
MIMLNDKEINALRYYIGDVSGNDPFFSDPKAYVVLNSLFFPGIVSEKARAAEGKFLNPAIIADTERLADFFNSLSSVFRKSVITSGTVTYRVERFSDYLLCRDNSQTVSFTSTSKSGFLSSYRDRLGIALMKFDISAGSRCIDVGAVLPHYAKPEESEILLPPFMDLSIDEIAMSDDELLITDSAGAPPKVSCTVTAGDIAPYTGDVPVLPSGGSSAGIRVYNALNAGSNPDSDDITEYSLWKKALRQILHSLFTQ